MQVRPGPHPAMPVTPRGSAAVPQPQTRRCGMDQLRVPKLLAGALAAVTAAVVASFFGVDGTLIGAALGSILVAFGETLYTRSLASAHTLARRSLVRRGGTGPAASEDGAGTAHPQPLRWRRVAVAAVAAFGIAIAAITGTEAVAQRPLASLVGGRPRQAASTSIGVVVARADRSASPTTRAPGTSTTAPAGSAPTTTAPLAVPTTTGPGAAPTTTAPTGTVPDTTATTITTPSSHTATTSRP
jgi:hypothetical protein